MLAGREQVLRDAVEALEIGALDLRTPRPLVLLGPRGVGKTVTLSEISAVAAERFSWPTVHVEAAAGANLLEEASYRLEVVTARLRGHEGPAKRSRSRISGGKVGAQAFGVGGEVELSRAPASPDVPSAGRRFATVLEEAMQAAQARDSGVLLSLDELHAAAPEELAQLTATLQEAVPSRWPLVVCAAALPSVRVTRGARALPTYLERAEWHELGPLTEDDARRALVEPAASAGRPLDDEAATVLLEVAGGYPYAVQVAGHFAWRASHGATRIEVAHARAAVPRISEDLGHLFESRWADASGKEREYLSALAAESRTEPGTSGQVARRLGKSVKAVSYLRERLIRKGTIYAHPDGTLRFITPGMGAWLRARDE